ncbi:hypothetical protein Hanom_Chr10g00913051 [Helianthus anomalus]
MELAVEEIMALRQEGTIKKYCDEFKFLFDQVKNSEEISEYYAIYLFMDGLEPEIRDVFITWHQYSFHTLKDYISLVLKLDAHKLKDSFSPYDPNSSLYEPHKVFYIMSGNDNGEISEDMGEHPGKDSMEIGQHEMGFSCHDSCVSKHALKLSNEMPKSFCDVIQVNIEKSEIGHEIQETSTYENDNGMFENEIGSLNQILSIQESTKDDFLNEDMEVVIEVNDDDVNKARKIPVVISKTKNMMGEDIKKYHWLPLIKIRDVIDIAFIKP